MFEPISSQIFKDCFQICLWLSRNNNEAGYARTPDGYLFAASFEQRTPQGNSAQNFKKALGHAAENDADVLVAYIKESKHTQQSIEDGIRKFEVRNQKRLKQIIIVTEDGKIHKHKHCV